MLLGFQNLLSIKFRQIFFISLAGNMKGREFHLLNWERIASPKEAWGLKNIFHFGRALVEGIIFRRSVGCSQQGYISGW